MYETFAVWGIITMKCRESCRPVHMSVILKVLHIVYLSFLHDEKGAVWVTCTMKRQVSCFQNGELNP